MTRILCFICAILSIGMLVAGFLSIGLDWFVIVYLSFGVLWIVGLALFWSWISRLALFFIFGASALGLYLDPSAGLRSSLPVGPYSLLGTGDPGRSAVFLICAAILALLAWDLAEFYSRLRQATPEDDISRLERRHLARVAVLTLAGGGICIISLTLQFKPSFEWMVILMVFSMWGVSRLVAWMSKKTG
jgi:hypothetical protein